jgi:hypothetical protein
MTGQELSRQAYRRKRRWLDRRQAERHTGGQEGGWTCVKQTRRREDKKVAGHCFNQTGRQEDKKMAGMRKADTQTGGQEGGWTLLQSDR